MVRYPSRSSHEPPARAQTTTANGIHDSYSRIRGDIRSCSRLRAWRRGGARSRHSQSRHPSCLVTVHAGEVMGPDLVIRGKDGTEHAHACTYPRYSLRGHMFEPDASGSLPEAGGGGRAQNGGWIHTMATGALSTRDHPDRPLDRPACSEKSGGQVHLFLSTEYVSNATYLPDQRAAYPFSVERRALDAKIARKRGRLRS